MKMKIAIIGATGYGGAELIRILHQHPEVTIHSLHTSSQEGKTISETYPHLKSIVTHDLDSINAEKIANEVDLVFTATPSGISTKLIPEFMKYNIKIVDLSGDFRLKNRENYEKWYGLDAADQETLDQAVYGLTEWVEGDQLKNTKLLSNPGCFPTAVLLGLAPLVKENIIDEHSIIIDAKTGVSGAGRGTSMVTHFSETNENLKIYRVNEHQHIPEIEQVLSNWNTNIKAVTFSTHLVPMTRGIMTTMYLNATTHLNINDLIKLYNDSYENDPFVRISEQGSYPSTREVYGSNYCNISLAIDKRTNRITVVSVIDNLMKGAAGQAVQNMNKMFGYDEKLGLEFVPVYP